MKKFMLGFLIKIVLVLTIIFSLYYVFILQPQIAQNTIEMDVKKILLEEKYALLQRRLAFVQLAKLNPTSSRYIYAKSRIYNDLEESEKTLTSMNEIPLPELHSFFSQHQSQYQELIDRRESQQQMITQLLEKDQQIINEQKQFDEQVDKLFEYFPSNDFPNLSEQNDCTIIEKKAQTAQEGIRVIEKKMTESALSQSFDQVHQSLKVIEMNCSSNASKAESARQDLITAIANLKKELFAKKMNLLLSNTEYLETIAQETQLVTEFDDLYQTAEAILTQ